MQAALKWNSIKIPILYLKNKPSKIFLSRQSWKRQIKHRRNSTECLTEVRNLRTEHRTHKQTANFFEFTQYPPPSSQSTKITTNKTVSMASWCVRLPTTRLHTTLTLFSPGRRPPVSWWRGWWRSGAAWECRRLRCPRTSRPGSPLGAPCLARRTAWMGTATVGTAATNHR